MNTTEKYIYRVYTEKSFSKAAKELFVSQPSLSAAIAHKEKELGFRIFDRSTKPISLTPEGHVYLNMLEEMLESEKNMRLRVQALSSERRKKLALGGSSSSIYYLLPSICGSFYRKHPEIEVQIDLGTASLTSPLEERLSLFQKLDRGDLDGVLCYEYDKGRYAGTRIYTERLAVAMRTELVPDVLRPYALTREELLGGEPKDARAIRDKTAFQGIPFLEYMRTGSTGKYMERLLGDYTPASCKISNARHSVVHFNMMCEGIGALLTSDGIVAHSIVDSERIVYFIFEKEISERSVYLATRKDLPPSECMEKFLQTAKEVGEA